jgi:hypothetical protein
MSLFHKQSIFKVTDLFLELFRTIFRFHILFTHVLIRIFEMFSLNSNAITRTNYKDISIQFLIIYVLGQQV